MSVFSYIWVGGDVSADFVPTGQIRLWFAVLSRGPPAPNGSSVPNSHDFASKPINAHVWYGRCSEPKNPPDAAGKLDKICEPEPDSAPTETIWRLS